jgi:hypothetical protein
LASVVAVAVCEPESATVTPESGEPPEVTRPPTLRLSGAAVKSAVRSAARLAKAADGGLTE